MKTKNMLFKTFMFLSLLSLFSMQTTAYAADISGTVSISGTAVFGQTLTASVEGGDMGAFYHYQWMRDTTPIDESDSADYLIVEADIGNPISVIVTAEGYESSLTGGPTADVEKADCEVTPIEAPVLDTNTDTTITLTAVVDYEYIIVGDGITELPEENWQYSNEFTGLTHNTPYDIYQRVKATDTHKASVVSDKLDVSTDPSELTGTASISGNAVFGQTLTAIFTGPHDGELSYRWLRGGVDITDATNVDYVLVEADINEYISVRVTSSIETGSVTSAQTAAVAKADSTPAKGITPVLDTATDTSLTVNAVAGYEYIIVDDGITELPDENWQGSNEFAGLENNTPYDIYQRVKETATHKASAISDKLDASTDPEALTGTVTISSNAVYGQELTSVVNIENNTGTLSYQWMRGSADISGATSETYTLVEADIGQQIKLKVTSSVETGEVTSAPTAEVQKADCETATGGNARL